MPTLARGQVTLSSIEHGNNATTIYLRTQFRPDTPSGNSPSNWSADDSEFSKDYGLLWSSSALKDGDGKLVGTWSKPILVEHYDSNMLWRFPWEEGSGSVDIYSQNGNTVENVRETDMCPFAHPSIIWKCIPDGGYPSKAGGFITTRCPIDQTLSLRISCWAKQVADDGNVFFAAFPGGGTEIYEGEWQPEYNPYLWQGRLPTFNKWYLLVGYLYGCESEVTEADARAGIYDPVTGHKVLDFPYIYRNSSEATHNGMRMFYNDTTTSISQLHLWEPRVDVVDGREPSVEELLKKSKDGDKGDGVVNIYRVYHSFPPQPSGEVAPPPGWSLTVPYTKPHLSYVKYDVDERMEWESSVDGYWASRPIEDDQSASIRVEFKTTVPYQTVAVSARVDSEEGYDELYIYEIDSEYNYLDIISGVQEQMYYFNVAKVGIHSINFMYYKDSSSSYGTDRAMVRVLPTVELEVYVSVGTVQNGKVVSWTNPVQFIGKDGSSGRAIVYRGEFSSSSRYYQNADRVDVVKHNSSYHMYKGPNATSGSWLSYNWKSFGGEFESVATNLLLAENANIADWIIKDGKITSQTELPSGKPAAYLDGRSGGMEFNSQVTKYTPTGGMETVEQFINISSLLGMIEVRNDDYDTSYISSQGIFANRAGIQAISATTGIELKAAVVALGHGELNKSAYDNAGSICGIYADSSNSSSSPAPSWGAYIRKLRALGLYVGMRRISSSTYLNAYDCFVSCYNTGACNIYLPANPQDGQMIIINKTNTTFPTVYGNGKSIHAYGKVVSSMTISQGAANSAILIYDGQYWKNIYMSWF